MVPAADPGVMDDAPRKPRTREPDFPELTRLRALEDREREARMRAMGLTPEQAKRHARDHAAERDREEGRP